MSVYKMEWTDILVPLPTRNNVRNVRNSQNKGPTQALSPACKLHGTLCDCTIGSERPGGQSGGHTT